MISYFILPNCSLQIDNVLFVKHKKTVCHILARAYYSYSCSCIGVLKLCYYLLLLLLLLPNRKRFGTRKTVS